MPTPTHAIWPTLPPAFANDILISVQKTNKKLYRTAVEVMAPRMGVRVPILIEMPKAQRHATWIQILGRPDMEVLSFNLLSAWLIETQTEMLCPWLDALGIEHGENGCADNFPPQPGAAALKRGVDVLLEKFDPQIVGVYLRTFNQIDETQWTALDEIIGTEPRLQMKTPALILPANPVNPFLPLCQPPRTPSGPLCPLPSPTKSSFRSRNRTRSFTAPPSK